MADNVPHDPPERVARTIAAARPEREATRPLACDRRPGCWVEVGPPSCEKNRPRCVACGGIIEFRVRA